MIYSVKSSISHLSYQIICGWFIWVTVMIFQFIICVFFLSSLQKVYKANYEKSRGFSINYCDTPKFQMDSVLKKFTDVRIVCETKDFHQS